MEVALGVEQTDSHQRDAEIGRGLEVVAREHPEPAGVLRERLGDAELRGEVGDELERRTLAGPPLIEPRARSTLDGIEPASGGGDPLHELAVGRPGPPSTPGRTPYQIDGMLVGVAPRSTDGAVEPIEQADQLAVPGPVQVRRQTDEWLEGGRQTADDGELVQGAHSREGNESQRIVLVSRPS